jgi:hypothetical protein
MAEVNKLSVGKVLDKPRRDDAPKQSELMQLDEKAEKMDERYSIWTPATTRALRAWTAILARLGRDCRLAECLFGSKYERLAPSKCRPLRLRLG